MKSKVQVPDMYILDSYRSGISGAYRPGAIIMQGRKKVETLQWKHEFPTQSEADAFVHRHCMSLGLKESSYTDEVSKLHARAVWQM